MAYTTISDLWIPEVMLNAVAESFGVVGRLIGSSVVYNNQEIQTRLNNSGGDEVQIPFYLPFTMAHAIQNPGTPITPGNVSSGKQIAPILNREGAVGVDALATALSGEKPIKFIADNIATVRAKNIEAVLIKMLRGVFADGDYDELGTDIITPNEDPVGDAGSNVVITEQHFYDAMEAMGDLEELMEAGIIWLHSKILADMKGLDLIDFTYASERKLFFKNFKGMELKVDDRLYRAGGTSGSIYEMYIAAPQSIAFAYVPQVADGTEASSLELDRSVPNLQKAVYDRLRYLLHVNGSKWLEAEESIATGGASDAQLLGEATGGDAVAHWDGQYNDVRNTRILQLSVNA